MPILGLPKLDGFPILKDDIYMEKKRKQKAQVQDLEQLLATGEESLHGRVCWSIANNDTEFAEGGDIITLEGSDGDGDPATRDFQLTDLSIEYIERCMGMRTCCEAQALFVEPRVPEPPLGECSNGHPEAAFVEEPTKGVDGQEYEICPECGDDSLELEGVSLAGWGWKITCLN